MNGATNVVSRLACALKGIFKHKSETREFVDAAEQKTTAASLTGGYREVSVPGGSVFVSSPTETAYFATESEFAPAVMNIKPATLAEANAAPARRARFEDPSAEFINADPRTAKSEIDYSVFTHRAHATPSVTPAVQEVATVEVSTEEAVAPAIVADPIEITLEAPAVEETVEVESVPEVTPVVEEIAVVPTVTVTEETVEVAPAEIPVVEEVTVTETVVEDVKVEETVEVAPAVEEVEVEAVAEIPAEPVVEVAPVEVAPVEVAPVEETVEASVEETVEVAPAEPEKSPAEEIADTIAMTGMAGMPLVAVPTSEVAVMPVFRFHLDDENGVIEAFDPMIGIEADELSSLNVEELPMPQDDGLEKLCFETPKVVAPVVEETVEVAPVEETPVVEAPVTVEETVEEIVVEAPVSVVEETVEVAPAVEEVEVEAVAEVPAEPVVEVTPVEEIKAAEPVILTRRAVNPADVAAILFG